MTIYQPTIQLATFQDINGNYYQDSFLDANNNISFLFGVDSVSQTVGNSISLWRGEYQFNVKIGSPWENILGESVNKTLTNSYISTAVLTTPYVVSIISIDYGNSDSPEGNRLNRIQPITVKYNNTDKTIGVANANI